MPLSPIPGAANHLIQRGPFWYPTEEFTCLPGIRDKLRWVAGSAIFDLDWERPTGNALHRLNDFHDGEAGTAAEVHRAETLVEVVQCLDVRRGEVEHVNVVADRRAI